MQICIYAYKIPISNDTVTFNYIACGRRLSSLVFTPHAFIPVLHLGIIKIVTLYLYCCVLVQTSIECPHRKLIKVNKL